MQYLLLLNACLVVVSATTLRFTSTERLDEEWKMFKQTFKKSYPSVDQETFRRIAFESNLRYIEKHNFEADLGRYKYRLGMNKYGDLTNTEYRKQLLGFHFNATRPKEGATFLTPSFIKLPATVDWRTKGYVTPVKDQGQCGSCWAFSATGSLEGQHFRKTHKLVSLSEQNLVDCSQRFGNMGCNGGLMDNAFKYIKVNRGIDTEMSYPYRAVDGRCRFNRRNVGATDKGFHDIESGSEEALQTATASVGPISVAIDASNPSFQLYQSGIYDEPDCSQHMLDHGVLVVGYGSDRGQDYWLVKNSWGESWGMQGYIKMSRNKDNQCGIATEASYPIV